MTKPQTRELRWERKEDGDWAASVEVRLVLDYDASVELCDQVLAEAREVVSEDGRTARELFGDPDAYARTAADERISEKRRARIDTSGRTPGERFSVYLRYVGWYAAIGLGFAWIRDGLWADVSGGSIVGAVTYPVACVLLCVAAAAHGAARWVRWAWGLGAGAVGVVGGGLGAGVAGVVPVEPLFSVPLPVVMLLGVAWYVAARKLPVATLDRWFASASDKGGDNAWFGRLGRLLRSRHGMTAAEARGHVQEARQHLAAASAGTSAPDVFGDVEVYAHRLAEGPRKRRRMARRNAFGGMVLTLVVAGLIVRVALESDPSWTSVALGTVFLAVCVGTTVSEWRKGDHSSAHRTNSP